MNWLRIDDPVGCIPVHGVTGVWSMLAVGIFSEQISHEKISAGIFQNGNARLLGVQLLSCVCMAAWATVTTLIEVSFFT